MIKRLSTLGLVSCFFILLFPTHTEGQTPVVPSTVNGYVDDLTTTFGTMISVPQGDISNFISGMLTDYSDKMDYPVPSYHSDNGNSITLEWAGVPGINFYNLGYINLTTGASGVTNFPVSTFGEYTLTGMPDGLYLFAAQSEDSPEVSATNIIIVDKEVHRVVLDDKIDCDCPVYLNSQILDSGQGATWPSIPFGIPFQLRIQDGFGGIGTAPLGKIQGLRTDSDEPIILNIECYSPDFEIEEENFVLYMYLDGEELGAFTLAPDYYFADDDLKIIYGECSDSEPRVLANGLGVEHKSQNLRAQKGNENLSITPSPNPFTDQLNLQLPEDFTATKIEIVNSIGAKVRTMQFSERKISVQQIKIDGTSLPPGQYFVVVYGSDEVRHIPVIKM